MIKPAPASKKPRIRKVTTSFKNARSNQGAFLSEGSLCLPEEVSWVFPVFIERRSLYKVYKKKAQAFPFETDVINNVW
jgi:hypothetical protein